MTRRRRGRPLITPLGSAVVLLLLAMLYLVFQTQSLAQRVRVPEETAAPEGWYTLVFSEPEGPNAGTLRGGPDARLVEGIDAARFSVDVAVYQLDLWSVRDALLRAHRRGVKVRVVTDSDNILEPEIQALESAGIEVLGDRRQPLMHHKFVVIDRLHVWTGSMNLTVRGAYFNDNNLLHLRSSRLAESYVREFEEMFTDDRFGALSMQDTPYPLVTIDGVRVEVLFSPDDGVAQRLVQRLQSAERSIDFLAFAFTSDEIAQAMLERAASGVRVRGVVERSQAGGQGSEYERLRSAGLQVRLDGNPGNMHHKVILIDGEVVITGSYNFSRSAEEKNDENLVIIEGPEMAQRYAEEFERLFAAAIP